MFLRTKQFILAKYQNILTCCWETKLIKSFITCVKIHALEYFSSSVEAFILPCGNIQELEYFSSFCGNLPSCLADIFKNWNISVLLWKPSFLPCRDIQELEYLISFVGSKNFRVRVQTILLAMQDYSNIRIFQGLCGILPSCRAGIYKYQTISGPMWEHSLLTCGNIQISEYFRARMGTFLLNMREYSNIGIFQGPCGKILSCRTVYVFTLSGIMTQISNIQLDSYFYRNKKSSNSNSACIVYCIHCGYKLQSPWFIIFGAG